MKRKHITSFVVLLVLALLTASVIINQNDMNKVGKVIVNMDKKWLVLCIATAFFFVSAEGGIIWYLLKVIGINLNPLKCVKWSFIGFFFSGITPSSTGGQPAQVYFMKRDGVKISDSMPVLMITAVLYKFIIVVIGLILGSFWWKKLFYYFGNYSWLFYFGLLLNVILVIVLVMFMVTPNWSKKVVLGGETLLRKLKILKESDSRSENLINGIDQYQEVVDYFKNNKFKIFVASIMTLIQRVSLFCLTWFIYRGLGLFGTDLLVILFLQAAVYIAVDMLPLPGSSGIMELVYYAAFAGIFTGELLTASMCISRGVSFYLILFVSALIFFITYLVNIRSYKTIPAKVKN